MMDLLNNIFKYISGRMPQEEREDFFNIIYFLVWLRKDFKNIFNFKL